MAAATRCLQATEAQAALMAAAGNAREAVEKNEEVHRAAAQHNDRTMCGIRHTTPSPPSGRFWVLDPIDGTKGFLRREHFAVPQT